MHSFNKSIGHIPVLISDFRKIFPKISGIWVDGTFGFGGYSKYLLEAGVEKLVVIDVDPDVKQHIIKLQAKWPSKIDFRLSNFIKIKNILKNLDIKYIDGVLLDIGVSSMQLDESLRGFSLETYYFLQIRKH